MINNRLRTTVDVEQKLQEMQNLLQLSSKAAVMRLSIAYSVKESGDPRTSKIDSRQTGADYARLTIFGDDEVFYKLMIETQFGDAIPDEVFFPDLTYAHICRGLELLQNDYKLYRRKEKLFLKNMR